jgi:hypothetical protein
MPIHYLSDIDLNKNSLLNVAVHPASVPPSSPVDGQIYYNNSQNDKKIYVYNSQTSHWDAVDGTSVATDTTLGSLKVYTGTGATANTITNTASRTYGVQLDGNNKAVVNVPHAIYGIATNSTPGLIELFNNTDQTADANTVTTTAGRTYGIQLNSADQAVVNVPWVNTTYSLADKDTRGLIQLYDATVQDVAANPISAIDERTYGLQVNEGGQGVINVPWTDTVYTHTTNANLSGVVTSTGNATAIADAALSIAKTNGLQTALNGKVASNSSITGATKAKITFDSKGLVTGGANLVAADIPALDASKITTGTINANILPSYVDDVLEFANLAAFPATGETGKIYIAIDTSKTYRWSGSVYVYITSGAVDSVAGKTGAVTLVKGDVDLGNVDNTADSAKNVFTATKLITPRAINGEDFDGSAPITVTAAAGTLTGASLNSTITGSSLTSVGTIGTGMWNGTTIAGQYGGTGVANTGKTITLGGNLTTSGLHATTLTTTGTTTVTLPTTGILATRAGAETLTNKTLTTPIISSISNTGTLTLPTSTGTLATEAYVSAKNKSFNLATTTTGVTVTSEGKIFTIAHGMGSSLLYAVQVIRTGANGSGETVFTDVTRTLTTITITFKVAPTDGDYTALITKMN